ncbi:MAG: ABC transporter permease [Planctomycetes bacterium]|nr:ABC transporter permease [Planctomycetota bacterium]
MIRRIYHSLGVQKFIRNRLALAALAVILLYFAAAGVVLLGGITLEEATQRAGPDNVPGFLETAAPEKRLQFCRFYLEPVERALKKKDPAAALREIAFAERRAAEKPAAELARIVESAFEIVDELSESENLYDQPALLPRLAALEAKVDSLYAPLEGSEVFWRRLRLSLGTDRQGRSIAIRAVYSIKVAVQVGLVTALVSVFVGSLLGGAAAYFGGWMDHLVIWLYSTFSSIPSLVLLAVLVYMFTGSPFEGTLIPVYFALCMTSWIGPCRITRGEVLKLKELEYVQAAASIGFGRLYILLRHILPNTVHLMLINFSLLFISAIKAEVILSFLGLGVKNEPSWGVMINYSTQEVINEFFWQIGAATAFMFVLVLAFNVLSDALQDAFDPRTVLVSAKER